MKKNKITTIIIYLIFTIIACKEIKASTLVAFFKSKDNSIQAYDVAIKIQNRWMRISYDGIIITNRLDQINRNYILLHKFVDIKGATWKELYFWRKSQYKMFSMWGDLSTISNAKFIGKILGLNFVYNKILTPDTLMHYLKNNGYREIKKATNCKNIF